VSVHDLMFMSSHLVLAEILAQNTSIYLWTRRWILEAKVAHWATFTAVCPDLTAWYTHDLTVVPPSNVTPEVCGAAMFMHSTHFPHNSVDCCRQHIRGSSALLFSWPLGVPAPSLTFRTRSMTCAAMANTRVS